MMRPAFRRLTFTTHVATSVGWFGAVLVFLALAAIGLTSDDEVVVRGSYLMMAPAAWYVLVPLAHASLISGIVLSLGTAWGLVRHYWVVAKLGLTLLATVILMIYMGMFRQMAGVAADPIVDVTAVRNASPLVHSALALMVLLVTTVLGVYKPFEMTAYGRRKHGERRATALEEAVVAPVTVALADRQALMPYVLGAIILAVLLLLSVRHFASTGFHH
jgi:hypothetical protein